MLHRAKYNCNWLNSQTKVCTNPASPPARTWQNYSVERKSAQFTISFNFFMAKARTVLEAGLALNTHGSLVKGLTPLRAGVAGFFFNFKFKQPPNLKEPFFFNSDAPISMRPSTTAFTCLSFKLFFSAMLLYAAEAVMAPPAFMA